MNINKRGTNKYADMVHKVPCANLLKDLRLQDVAVSNLARSVVWNGRRMKWK
jgi:hypothetical protein